MDVEPRMDSTRYCSCSNSSDVNPADNNDPGLAFPRDTESLRTVREALTSKAGSGKTDGVLQADEGEMKSDFTFCETLETGSARLGYK